MKRLFAFWIFLAVLLLGCGRKVTLTGQITHSETARPVAGAWVYDPTMDTLSGDTTPTKAIEGMPPNRQIVTADQEGRYVIKNVSSRRHLVYFAADGFESVKVDFKAKGRDTIYELNVKLEPMPIEVIY